MRNYVARDFSRYVQEHIQEDDCTLIAVKYMGPNNTVDVSAKKNLTTWTDDESTMKKSEPTPDNSKSPEQNLKVQTTLDKDVTI
jgi:hypothetical protein